MEQAIELAIKGGWSTSYVSLNSKKYYEKYLLDPLFWQALGKSLGWNKTEYHESKGIEVIAVGKHKCNQKCSPRLNYYGVEWVGEVWKFHWHRFIDHLAEGKDVEEFFTNLTRPTAPPQ